MLPPGHSRIDTDGCRQQQQHECDCRVAEDQRGCQGDGEGLCIAITTKTSTGKRKTKGNQIHCHCLYCTAGWLTSNGVLRGEKAVVEKWLWSNMGFLKREEKGSSTKPSKSSGESQGPVRDLTAVLIAESEPPPKPK
eukprot:6491906-Amphidinium_carterae.1